MGLGIKSFAPSIIALSINALVGLPEISKRGILGYKFFKVFITLKVPICVKLYTVMLLDNEIELMLFGSVASS